MAKGKHHARQDSARWRSVSLIMVGVVVGMLFITPAGAHFKRKIGHLINHMKGTFYTKAQIDQRATGCRGNGSGDAMVKVGPVCIDKYENSIWTAKTGGTQITGAIPCLANGQDCKGKIFARSVAGVAPRADITWFQAQAALANSGKRLPTNAEWQMAAQGTPDSTACNVGTGSVANTGANAGCISSWGARDMVGNLWEWVADWDEAAWDCANWSASLGSDRTCVGRGSGEPSSRFPGALYRGGYFGSGSDAGVFAVHVLSLPSSSSGVIGFRGAR